MNQIAKSGSSFFDARPSIKNRSPKQRFLNLVALSLSLFLIGSCNERATFMDFAATKPDLNLMEKADLMRYAYALQAGLMNAPQNIAKLRTVDIKLALADPDLARADGKARVWQYRANSCVLDVYWRATGEDVRHHEFRTRESISRQVTSQNNSSTTVAPKSWSCIQNIIQERRAKIEDGLHDTYAVLSLNAHKS